LGVDDRPRGSLEQGPFGPTAQEGRLAPSNNGPSDPSPAWVLGRTIGDANPL
jgi:hypothetical protein